MVSHYSKQLLANGLTLLTIPMPGVESVTVLVTVRVGSRNETARIRGLTHFMEHMPFKGTQKYPTSLVLSSAVDGVGAEFNAFTSKEYTGFYVKAAAKHLPLALDILSQLVFYPLIDSQELEKEKGVIVEEINMYEDQPMARVMLDFELLLYGNTSLGWESIGTKETVRGVNRQDFLDYMNRWYHPYNMVVGIAGRVDKNIKELVGKYFSEKKKLTGLKVQPYNLKFSQTQPAINLRSKKTEQAHLCLGVRALPRMHPDRWVLATLATILGGNMSSRLFMEVREKRGLAYYIKTAGQAYLDNGYLITRAGTDINKTAEAIRVIWEEYKKISNVNPPAGGQISKLELTKAKEFLKGRLVLELEDSEEVASLYTEDYLLEGKVYPPEEIIKEIDKVTWEDVRRVAAKIFRPENLNLAIIGPYKEGDRQRFEKILE